MKNDKLEIRTLQGSLSVREAAEGATEPSRTITGRAIVFNAESEVLDDWGTRFREVIEPSACTKEFVNGSDIKLNLLHDRSQTVARKNEKGEGNLTIEVREDGVYFEFEAPKCDIGDRCLEMVRSGVYTGCSFEFYPDEYDIEERDGGKDVLIRHKKFRALTALTIGMDPAYKQTSVNARELTDNLPTNVAARELSERKRETQLALLRR